MASAILTTNLTWMREEERLARDLYMAFAARYDQAQPFVTIAQAEQRHFDAVGTLLTRYGVTDPSAGRPAGTYAEPELQALYDRLVAQGERSLTDAYDAGIAVETEDIADLTRILGETTETDVTRVLSNQLRASQHHLAAFGAAKAGTPMGTHDGMGRQAGQGRGQGASDMPGARRGGGQGLGTGTCINR